MHVTHIHWCALVASYKQATHHAQDTALPLRPVDVSYPPWLQRQPCPLLHPLPQQPHTHPIWKNWVAAWAATSLGSACARFTSCCLCGSLPICAAVAVTVLVSLRSARFQFLLKFLFLKSSLVLCYFGVWDINNILCRYLLAVITSCPLLSWGCARREQVHALTTAHWFRSRAQGCYQQ